MTSYGIGNSPGFLLQWRHNYTIRHFCIWIFLCRFSVRVTKMVNPYKKGVDPGLLRDSALYENSLKAGRWVCDPCDVLFNLRSDSMQRKKYGKPKHNFSYGWLTFELHSSFREIHLPKPSLTESRKNCYKIKHLRAPEFLKNLTDSLLALFTIKARQ